MVKLDTDDKAKIVNRVNNALELIRLGEQREAFSLLSKQLFLISQIDYNKKSRQSKNSRMVVKGSWIYKYQLVFELIKEYRIKGCKDFLLSFALIDTQFGFNDFLDPSFKDTLISVNYSLLMFIDLIMKPNNSHDLQFNVSGYTINDQLNLDSVIIDLLDQYFLVLFSLLEYNIDLDDELYSVIDQVISIKANESDFTKYENIITEYDFEQRQNRYNFNKVCDTFRRYKMSFEGDGKSKAIQNAKGEIEALVHKMSYPYVLRDFSDSYVFSELTTTGDRYDLFISNNNENLALVVEFKVIRTGRPKIDEAIDQVIRYLDRGKTEIFKQALDFGVVYVLNATNREIESDDYKLYEEDNLHFIEDERLIICEIKM